MTEGESTGTLAVEAERLRERIAHLEAELAARSLTGGAPVTDSSAHPDGLLADTIRTLLATNVVSICVVDAEGGIVFANPGAERILGLKASEIQERRYDAPQWKATAVDGGEWTEEMQPFRIVMSTGQPVHDVRHAIEWPDGLRKILSIDGAPVFGADGRIRRVGFSLQDITEQLRVEEQLNQARRLESVGRLAGGVAHDFNNLLTVVSGCAELLDDRFPDAPDVQELSEPIHEAAERGIGLTRQLLSFAKRQVLRTERIDVNECVSQAARLLERTLGERIELELRLAPQPSWSEVDPDQLQQVLVQLAINARDAMPEGGSLWVETGTACIEPPPGVAASPTGDWITLTISDTGHGIESRALPHVFEPFYTTKNPSERVGLGLSTCFGIVQQAGGWMEADSRVGEGSTLRAFLPATERPVASVTPEVNARARSAGGADGEGYTALLVEDDEMVRSVVRRMLEQLGFQLLEAKNGAEALELFFTRADEVDLLLTDVVMPKMSGLDLARELVATREELRVLFVSGYSAELGSLSGDEWAEGRTFLLQKPFSRDALAQKLHAMGLLPAPPRAEV